ncbi:MAG: hypothetical protein Q9224_004313 [Gallowayella concinna]
MSQTGTGKTRPPPRNDTRAKLATNIDPKYFGNIVSNSVGPSSASSKQGKPTPPAPSKTREQIIAEAYGDPVSKRAPKTAAKEGPKGTFKENELSWSNSPAQISSSKAPPPSIGSNYRSPSLYSGAPQQPKPIAGPSSAVSASQAAPFPCPHADCNRGFQKLGALRKHKDQEHDYCMVCDEDFDDDDALHKHKIMSERHITCTVCSLDFKSEMGRDRHYEVMHAASNNVKCRGCDTTFAKGSALILHFERDQCRPMDRMGISADRFEAQRAAMAMAMQTKNTKRVAQTDSAGGSLRRADPIHQSVAASSVGGVPIDASEQPDFLTDNDLESRSFQFQALSRTSSGTERPASPTESHAETDLLSFEHDRPDALNASNLATLNQGYGPGGTAATSGLADWPALGTDKGKGKIIEGMSNMDISAAQSFANAQDDGRARIHAPPSVQPSKSGFTVVGETGVELRPNPVTGEWECPYYKCNFKALIRQDLEAHFEDRNNGHRSYEHQCPTCLKRFKTASAIIAHLESPSVRCTIRHSKGFGNVLHLVSGGHLNVAGRHNDGSNRLVVPKEGTLPEDMW